jgi:hypothetical protein
MKISKLQLSDKNPDAIVEFLLQEMTFDYENHSTDMYVLAKEVYYFRTKSKQLNMIVLKMKNSVMEIDLIGCAGGRGLLNITFGSEASFVSNAQELLQRYAREKDLKLEERSEEEPDQRVRTK